MSMEDLKINVIYFDGYTVVTNWDPVLEGPFVFSKRRRMTPEEQKVARERAKEAGRKVRNREYTNERVCLYSLDEKDATKAVFLSGLNTRFKRFLIENKVRFIETDKRVKHNKPLKADFSKIQKLRGPQPKVVAAVLSSPGGIVHAATGFGKSFVIRQLCKALCETYTILVVTRRTSVLTQLYKDIRQDLFKQVGILTGSKRDLNSKRVICVTEGSLKSIDPKEVDIVFYDEAHGIGDNEAGRMLARFCSSRKYGFTATPVRTDNAERTMEALFGPILVKVNYSEAVNSGNVVPIQVRMVKNNQQSWLGVSNDPDGVEKASKMPSWIYERYAYWQNFDRNKLIATTAKDILLEQPDDQVLIMVNTVEHAIAIHQYLPGFIVMYSGNLNKDTLSKAFQKYKRQPDLSKYELSPKDIDIATAAFRKGTLKRVISTGVWREGVDFSMLSYLIRADAGATPIGSNQIPGRLSRLSDGKECGILYDFTDGFCSRSENKSKTRVKEYKNNGWEIINI